MNILCEIAREKKSDISIITVDSNHIYVHDTDLSDIHKALLPTNLHTLFKLKNRHGIPYCIVLKATKIFFFTFDGYFG